MKREARGFEMNGPLFTELIFFFLVNRKLAGLPLRLNNNMA